MERKIPCKAEKAEAMNPKKLKYRTKGEPDFKKEIEKAYKKTKVYEIEKLLKKEKAYQAKMIYAQKNLARVRKQINKMTMQMAEKETLNHGSN